MAALREAVKPAWAAGHPLVHRVCLLCSILQANFKHYGNHPVPAKRIALSEALYCAEAVHRYVIIMSPYHVNP